MKSINNNNLLYENGGKGKSGENKLIIINKNI